MFGMTGPGVPQNSTQQTCSIDLLRTQVSDETGVAIAEALRQNSTLRSCSIDLSCTQVSDELLPLLLD